MNNILVTGASGFIGQRLMRFLLKTNLSLVAITREPGRVSRRWPDDAVTEITADLATGDGLVGACKNIDTVFHLAGYAHASDQQSADAERLHREVTVDGMRNLLTAAITAGVSRMIFLSSVKAMGEGNEVCRDENCTPSPTTHYGRAKLEAEKLLLEAGKHHGIHVCVLRLPLVYGPGNKGNIPRMIRAIACGRFPPVPEVHNRRSMVHVDDVVQALVKVEENDAARGRVYIVTDGREYSTREIYIAICRALGRRIPEWTVPAWLFHAMAGVGDVIEWITHYPVPVSTSVLEKLLGSSCYSADRIRRELGFVPRYTLEEALPEMIAESVDLLARTNCK